MIKRLFIVTSCIFIFLIIPFSSAYFYVNIINYNTENSKPYENQNNKISGFFKIDKDDWEANACIYDCTIRIGSGESQKINRISGGVSTSFSLENILMTGSNHVFQQNLEVVCKRTDDVSIYCGFDTTDGDKYKDSREIQILLNNSQDSTCDFQNGENCKNNPACMLCQSPQYNCNPDSPRQKDDYGCTTSCGNGFIESTYESCSTCSQDVGKCDGLSCSGDSECIKNHYCVWNVCSDKSYRINDGHCDLNKGETCLNSEKDCACKNNMQCNRQTAQCETYCGNGICEQEEAGKCKVDCQWCGDGICNANENCKMCDLDCGKCKEEEKPSLIGSFFSNNAENQKNTELEKILEKLSEFLEKIKDEKN